MLKKVNKQLLNCCYVCFPSLWNLDKNDKVINIRYIYYFCLTGACDVRILDRRHCHSPLQNLDQVPLRQGACLLKHHRFLHCYRSRCCRYDSSCSCSFTCSWYCSRLYVGVVVVVISSSCNCSCRCSCSCNSNSYSNCNCNCSCIWICSCQ